MNREQPASRVVANLRWIEGPRLPSSVKRQHPVRA